MIRVLILEDEEMLRSSMLRSLSKMPDVAVDGAGTLDDALIAIDASPPNLIFSDLDLPGRAGIELVGELSIRRLEIPIVFISAYLNAYGSQIPPNAAVRVLEKPVELQQLRELVLEHAKRIETANFESPPFSAVDYIQLASMGGQSIRIRLVDTSGGSGEIIVFRGEVWSAEDVEGSGRDALRRLVVAKAASLECGVLSEDRGPRNVEGRTEELLLEALRLEDERDRNDIAPGEDSIDSAFDQTFAPETELQSESDERVSDGFLEAMDRGLEAMLAKDFESALLAFQDARRIRPEDRTAKTNLIRLHELGFGAEEGSEVT